MTCGAYRLPTGGSLEGRGLSCGGADGLDPVELEDDEFQRGVAKCLLSHHFLVVVADQPAAAGSTVETDLLDAQVVADLGVAALPGQGLFD